MTAELRETVRACIDRLPEAYREVILLRDIEELDTEETSRVLGETANCVKTRLHRARAHCGSCSCPSWARHEAARDPGPDRPPCPSAPITVHMYWKALSNPRG